VPDLVNPEDVSFFAEGGEWDRRMTDLPGNAL
jgi:hypothetical protein